MRFLNKSKVTFSGQIFFQYFISAVIPVLILSYFTYTSVSELLNKNANRQIYSESRAVGLTLFDRLLNVESNLLFSSRYISNKEELEKYRWLNKMFESIYVTEKGQLVDILIGQEAIEFDLTERQKKHLKSKGLLTIVKDKTEFYPLVILAINAEEEKYIVGNVNLNYFWSIYVNGNDIFCVVIDKTKLVYCSDGREDINSRVFDKTGSVINFKQKTKDKPYTLSIKQRDYVSNIWDLFLDPQYGTESFLILYFIRKDEAFFGYNFFKNVFPKTLFLTLLLVYLFSSVQMRRSLVPLEKLTSGVKKIISGNYGTKVDIETDNEFKSLASAFNLMSSQIDSQFIKIKTLSKIDRLILSASDTEYIVEVLLEYMPKIISGDHFSLMTFNDSSEYLGIVYYFESTKNKVLSKSNVTLEESEYAELENTVDIIESSNKDKTYFSVAKNRGCDFFIAYPVRDKEKLLAVILIGYEYAFKKDNAFLDDIKEVSDRAAVAISNAQWEKKLFHQAHFDALTNLPNRYLFKDRLDQAIERAKRNGLNVAVLFIDLDRFKSVNDSLGHAVGDELLVKVSEVLLKCVRAYDSVSRFGGDEYTIVISDVVPEQIEEKAEQLAARILSMMSEPIVINMREFYVSPSIGISIYPKDANNFDDLLKNADSAMYKAKKLSSGNYQFYQPVQNSEVLAKMQMEVELRHAINKDQFNLVFQPKLNLRSGKVYGVEALIRWEHPQKGIIPPNVFIPIAEESGLIKNIGYWVMKKAFSTNKEWQNCGINLTTAINVSTDQFRHPGFFKNINEILLESKILAKNIELEITESITIDDFTKTSELLEQLREIGFQICIDDFGTGYSSMTYLQKIPINTLKIDKYFVDDIANDADAASIIRAIIALAHNMNLKVVAEGVENKEQFQYLSDINCDEIQGYYLSKPLSSEEVIQFIERYNSQSD